jgi:hypothetical protein
MATPLATGNIMTVRVWYRDNEQAAVNTFHYLIQNGTPGPTDEDMGNQIDTFLKPLMPLILYNGAEYRGVEISFANVKPLPMPILIHTATVMGTGGAVGIPRNASCVGSWVTDFTGPRYRGRTYWPFASTSHVQADGDPTPAYTGHLVDVMTALLDYAVVTGGAGSMACSLVVLSRVGGLTTKFIKTFKGLAKFGTMKKRGSFGKANVSPL